MKVANYSEDTRLKAAVISPSLPKALDVQCHIATGAPRWKTEFRILGDKNASKRFREADPYERAVYNAKDALMTDILDDSLNRRMPHVHNSAGLYQTYMELNEIAIDMRRGGIRIVEENISGMRKMLIGKYRYAKRELRKIAEEYGALQPNSEGVYGFNPVNHRHVKLLFIEKFKVTPTRWSETTGEPSFDEAALLTVCRSPEPVIRKAASLTLQARKWNKLLASYIDNLPVTDAGYVHPCWNPDGAKTGRWSAQDPAVQTIPNPEYRKRKDGTEYLYAPGLRSIFGPKPGCQFVEVDARQFEAYTIAYMSDDAELIRMLDTGDVHTETAKIIFNLDDAGWKGLTDEMRYQFRQLAKKARYQLHYGSTAENAYRKLVPDFNDLTLSQVLRLWSTFKKIHPNIIAWQNAMVAGARKNRYVECEVDGRRYQFWGEIEPAACYNTPNQMTVAAVTNAAIIRIVKRLRKKYKDRLLGQVHDSIIAESTDPHGLVEIIKDEFAHPVTIGGKPRSIATDAKIGPDWGNLQKLKAA